MTQEEADKAGLFRYPRCDKDVRDEDDSWGGVSNSWRRMPRKRPVSRTFNELSGI